MSKESKKPTVILGNNITAKFKSATFWTGMIPVLATFVVSVLSLLGVNGAEDIVNQYTAIATTLVSILAGFGVLVSHDTKGIADSEISQTFTKPRDSKDPDQGLEWSNGEWSNGESSDKDLSVDKTLTPKEYTQEDNFENVDEHEYDEDEEPYKDQSKPYGVDWDEKVDTTKNIQDNKEGVLITGENTSTSKVLDK